MCIFFSRENVNEKLLGELIPVSPIACVCAMLGMQEEDGQINCSIRSSSGVLYRNGPTWLWAALYCLHAPNSGGFEAQHNFKHVPDSVKHFYSFCSLGATQMLNTHCVCLFPFWVSLLSVLFGQMLLAHLCSALIPKLCSWFEEKIRKLWFPQVQHVCEVREVCPFKQEEETNSDVPVSLKAQKQGNDYTEDGFIFWFLLF